jgi:hypothetical protein
VPCSSKAAKQLNAQQDGHRITVNPQNYSEVPKPGGGYYARTECVKDDVTGLMWEGKAASGIRAGSNTYTNYDNTALPQKLNGYSLVNPSQADIDATSNATGYKNQVNSSALCGYSDWRLPTVDELESLVNNSSVSESGAGLTTLNSIWFPNTLKASFHTATNAFSGPENAWQVHFGTNRVDSSNRFFSQAIRLVRGQSLALPRATASCPSLPTHERFAMYGEEVIDRLTNLQWARCSIGQVWDGVTCTGSATAHTHEQALIVGASQNGWRLPSRRELFSLADKACNNPSIDLVAFPGTPPTAYWTASSISPEIGGNILLVSDKSWVVVFTSGTITDSLRANNYHPLNGASDFLNYRAKAVRLVRVQFEPAVTITN